MDKELNREQVMLWAMDAGFTTQEARNNIQRFEKFARHVEWFCIDREKDDKLDVDGRC